MHFSEDQIVFNNPSGTYKPGDVVSGNVIMDNPEEKFIDSIVCKFKGITITGWDGVQKAGVSTYFHKEVTLVQATDPTKKFPAGRHQLPFAFQLPQSIPPSFYGRNGSTRYTVKITINRPKQVVPIVAKKEFFVKKPLTVTQWNQLEKIIPGCEAYDTRPGDFSPKGKIGFQSRLSTKILTPGVEAILFTSIHNMSRHPLNKISISIYKKVSYYSHAVSLHKDTTFIVDKTRFDMNILPCEVKNDSFKFRVPANCTAAFSSQLIDVSYKLRLSIHKSGFFSNPVKYVFPIVVAYKSQEPEVVAEPEEWIPVPYPNPDAPRLYRDLLNVIHEREHQDEEVEAPPPTYREIIGEPQFNFSTCPYCNSSLGLYLGVQLILLTINLFFILVLILLYCLF